MELIILKVSGPSWWVDVFFSDFFTFCLDKGNLSLTLSLNWQTGSINQPPTGWGRDVEDGEDGEDDQPCLQYLVRGCWWCWHARVWVLTVTACPLPQHQCEAGGRLSWALVCQPLLSTHDSGAARRTQAHGDCITEGCEASHTITTSRLTSHVTPLTSHLSHHTQPDREGRGARYLSSTTDRNDGWSESVTSSHNTSVNTNIWRQAILSPAVGLPHWTGDISLTVHQILFLWIPEDFCFII